MMRKNELDEPIRLKLGSIISSILKNESKNWRLKRISPDNRNTSTDRI